MKFYQCVQNENENVSVKDTIKAIKEAGFDGVFVQWYNKDWEVSQEEQLKFCKEVGLEVPFVHLNYNRIRDIWADGPAGDEVIEEYIDDLNKCKEYGINLVMMHVIPYGIKPEKNIIAVKRYQRIVDYAEKLGIKVAFENTRYFGFLEYIFEYIKNDNVGICFDSGHYHCHFKDKFSWNLFRDKIFILHLHDNNGEWDEHKLPFDGNLDWNDVANKLKDANYKGVISLESCYRKDYANNMDVYEFYKRSFESAKKIDQLLK